MPAFRDLTGQKFGKWTVVKWIRKQYAQQFWLCKCDCGIEKEVVGDSLKKGLSKSCGCAGKIWCTTHNMSKTPIYECWAAMIQRCENPKNKWFPRYGGRGIKVCKEWREDFRNFHRDMGDRPKGLELERINNDGDYTPENCRWATRKEQIRNRMTTKKLTFNGETLSLPEWAGKMNIKRKVLEHRIRDGWETEKALTTPKSGRWGVIKCT